MVPCTNCSGVNLGKDIGIELGLVLFEQLGLKRSAEFSANPAQGSVPDCFASNVTTPSSPLRAFPSSIIAILESLGDGLVAGNDNGCSYSA